MAEDDSVFVIGEDVAGCNGSQGEVGSVGGVFGVTGGLYKAFGPNRCIDTPISESAIVGAAAGAALVGMRTGPLAFSSSTLLIFVPSIARFREDYMMNRLERAQIASLALLANDMIDILNAINASGALHAELIVR